MSRPRVPEPAYGAQSPRSADSRDSYGVSPPQENVAQLYYDDEDVEQSHAGAQQYDRRQQYPYPSDQGQQAFKGQDPPYDPYGTTGCSTLP